MLVIRPSLAVLVFVTLLSTAATRGAESNWPRWRGPEQDGHTADATLPVKWSAGDIVWKLSLIHI